MSSFFSLFFAWIACARANAHKNLRDQNHFRKWFMKSLASGRAPLSPSSSCLSLSQSQHTSKAIESESRSRRPKQLIRRSRFFQLFLLQAHSIILTRQHALRTHGGQRLRGSEELYSSIGLAKTEPIPHTHTPCWVVVLTQQAALSIGWVGGYGSLN